MQGVKASTTPIPDDEYLLLKVNSCSHRVKLIPFRPKKFLVGDLNAATFLEENGFVVFSAVASATDVSHTHDLFWSHLERVSRNKISRSDSTTWTDARCWPGLSTTGILPELAHSEMMWKVRDLPLLHEAFAQIWNTKELLVSIDAAGAFRPQTRTNAGWFHVDQNIVKKPGKQCIQALLALSDSSEDDGGLVVVPQSHLRLPAVAKAHPQLFPELAGDFIPLDGNTLLPELWGDDPHAFKICCSAGDLVMWDSRTAHCSHPSRGVCSPNQLRRLVAYVCMTPVSCASNLPALSKERLDAYQKCIASNHWPHEHHPMCDPLVSSLFRPPKLNEHQMKLLVGNYS